jgi:hypothetical protein
MPRLLTEADLPAMLTLQHDVLEHLKSRNNANFIVPRDAPYFTKHMVDPHAIYGLSNDVTGAMEAQAIYHCPQSFNVTHTGLAFIPGLENGSNVSILQGALVHPTLQRQGLMRVMLSHWLNWCYARGIAHVLARVEITHVASRKAFEQQGLHVVGTVIDARDDASVHVLIKHL